MLASKAECDQLAEFDVELLNAIFESYGSWKSWAVVNHTHALPEWTDPGENIDPDRSCGHPSLRRLQRLRDRVGRRSGRSHLPDAQSAGNQRLNPGDTFFGLDEKWHLWVILSDAADDGSVVVVNFTTHDLARRATCHSACVVVAPGEHSYPSHDSCIFYLGAAPANVRLIRERVANGRYEALDPILAPLLERIRRGALISPDPPEPLKPAIRRSLRQS